MKWLIYPWAIVDIAVNFSGSILDVKLSWLSLMRNSLTLISLLFQMLSFSTFHSCMEKKKSKYNSRIIQPSRHNLFVYRCYLVSDSLMNFFNCSRCFHFRPITIHSNIPHLTTYFFNREINWKKYLKTTTIAELLQKKKENTRNSYPWTGFRLLLNLLFAYQGISRYGIYLDRYDFF